MNPSRDWSPRLIPSCKLYRGPVPPTGPCNQSLRLVPSCVATLKKGEKVRLQTGMQSSFIEMCEKSREQDNARFERSAEMFRDHGDAQSRQMEQTNAIVDIFKDLASK